MQSPDRKLRCISEHGTDEMTTASWQGKCRYIEIMFTSSFVRKIVIRLRTNSSTLINFENLSAKSTVFH